MAGPPPDAVSEIKPALAAPPHAPYKPHPGPHPITPSHPPAVTIPPSNNYPAPVTIPPSVFNTPAPSVPNNPPPAQAPTTANNTPRVLPGGGGTLGTTSQYLQLYYQPTGSGDQVVGIMGGGPTPFADGSTLQVGDVILSVGGQPANSGYLLDQLIANAYSTGNTAIVVQDHNTGGSYTFNLASS